MDEEKQPPTDDSEAARIREQVRANQQAIFDDARRQQNEIHEAIMRQVFGDKKDT